VTWRFVGGSRARSSGVALVVGLIGGLTTGDSDAGGVILLLLGVLCCALYPYCRARWSALPTLCRLVAIAAKRRGALRRRCARIGYALGSIHELVALPPATVATAVVSGLLYYAAAYWLYLTALRFVPAGVAGAYFQRHPVFGVGFAVIFLRADADASTMARSLTHRSVGDRAGSTDTRTPGAEGDLMPCLKKPALFGPECASSESLQTVRKVVEIAPVGFRIRLRRGRIQT